jgi:hypothetical protein
MKVRSQLCHGLSIPFQPGKRMRMRKMKQSPMFPMEGAFSDRQSVGIFPLAD